jgi:hypothetical protein
MGRDLEETDNLEGLRNCAIAGLERVAADADDVVDRGALAVERRKVIKEFCRERATEVRSARADDVDQTLQVPHGVQAILKFMHHINVSQHERRSAVREFAELAV